MSSKTANSRKVQCPVCSRSVAELDINSHLDNNCSDDTGSASGLQNMSSNKAAFSQKKDASKNIAPIFSQKRPSEPLPLQSKSVAFSSKDSRPLKRAKTSATHLSDVAPLAERLRPRELKDFVGQEHLTGPDSPLLHLLQGTKRSTVSLILWGPSGSGKTTLARLLANSTDAVFKELSATSSGTTDVRAVFEEAKGMLTLSGRRTILFLDEVHRFNRAQQDLFLPYVEQGHIQLIGATTENPSFKINSALLSRCRVFVLEQLTEHDILEILDRAIARISLEQDEQVSDAAWSSSPIQSSSQSSTATIVAPKNPLTQITSKIKASIASLAAGDARTALSLLELVITSPSTTSEARLLESLRRSVSTRYDRTGDSHYDMISAMHKSVRGSDGSAALYWLARMLIAGEDPLYIARRLVVMASEDIGLANSNGLPLATATYLACQHIGMPECRINLAHCVAYLAESPKSTRAYEAYNRAAAAAEADVGVPVPNILRNAPTPLMKDLGYGKEYAYNPQFAHPVYQEYLPPHLRGEKFLKAEGDSSGKLWDEDKLRKWELECNDGKAWNGRNELERSKK